MVESQKKDRKIIVKIAKEVIKTEIRALNSLIRKTFNKDFVNLINSILEIRGKIILSGVGKSGIIAKKIASTLISIETNAVFLHPVEALHGDIGMVADGDLSIILSNSGETPEIIKFAQILKRKRVKIFSITNKPDSKLASLSDHLILLHTPKEACPHNLVPTSSTTAMLALGDAIAITIMRLKKYSKEDFANSHPGGNIGRLIYLKVSDIMRKGKDNPIISENATIKDAIAVMTATSLGAVSIVDKKGRLKGFFTDGDIRRKLGKMSLDDKITYHMTRNPITITSDRPIIEAARVIQAKNIDNIPVVDKEKRVIGIVDERDLIREGIL